MKELFFNTIQEFNDYIGVKTLTYGGNLKFRFPSANLTIADRHEDAVC